MMSTRWRIRAVALVIGVVALAPAGGRAAEASVSVHAASAYVFRGATFNDGLVLQPGLELSGFPLPDGSGNVTVGAWGNLDLDDYDGAVEDGQFSEIDLYGSYSLPVEAVALSIGYTEYTYPSGGGDADREVSLSAGLDLLLAPSAAVHYGVDGAIDGNLYVEAGVGHGLELAEKLSLELTASVAYLDPDEGDDGFSHYTASVGLSYSLLSMGITYVGQVDDDVLPDIEDGGAYDVDIYGTVGLSFDF
jgi:uncharacterized protein (TIGR02001 family)